jgi:hypothetical protein
MFRILSLSSFAENPELSSSGMNAQVEAVIAKSTCGFSASERFRPKDEWMLRALARRASFYFLTSEVRF